VEEESIQKGVGSDSQNSQAEPLKGQPPEKHPNDASRGGQKRVGWPVWLLIVLIVFLLAASIANLIVSHRAYENSLKQVTAIEQLAQSIKDTQRSIMNLAKMLEQSSPEEEETDEDRGASGDGSI